MLALGGASVTLGFNSKHASAEIALTWRTSGERQDGINFEVSVMQKYVAGKGLQQMCGTMNTYYVENGVATLGETRNNCAENADTSGCKSRSQSTCEGYNRQHI